VAAMPDPIVVTHPRQFKAAMSQHERPVIVQRNWRTLYLWCLLAVYEWADHGRLSTSPSVSTGRSASKLRSPRTRM
jgi:hypothetical protein